MSSFPEKYFELKTRISISDIPQALSLLQATFPGQLTFSTSFSFEDQVITDLIYKSNIPVSIFTLDTGRLFSETYYTWTQTLDKYGLTIDAYYPDAVRLQEFITGHGPNSFYNSVDLRKKCCHIRKVEPLQRALAGKLVWVTGLRAEHSANRHELEVLEWDENYRVFKYNPLLHYTTVQLKQYLTQYQVPYNPLHDKGFISIGCAPCTRAIRAGEDFRAGRWWWEDASKKECGLHVHEPDAKN